MLPIQSAKEREAKGRKAAEPAVHHKAEGMRHERMHGEHPKPKMEGEEPKRAHVDARHEKERPEGKHEHKPEGREMTVGAKPKEHRESKKVAREHERKGEERHMAREKMDREHESEGMKRHEKHVHIHHHHHHHGREE
jgi:hypothetical protein